jgi:hypothetical protein
MAILKNPFGVGYSGSGRLEFARQCQCCQIEFLWTGTKDTVGLPARCKPCVQHTSDSPESELHALREHQVRLIETVATARRIAREAKSEIERMKNEVNAKNSQVAAALESRDRWRRQMEAIQAEHPAPRREGTSCGCNLSGCRVAAQIDARRRSPFSD